MWQDWWVWVVAGLAIGVLEMLMPGYIFLGFMAGAIATGVLIGMGVLGGSFAVALSVFAVLSLVAWIALRKYLGKRAGDVKIISRDINEG